MDSAPLWQQAQQATLKANDIASDDNVRGTHIGEAFSSLGPVGGLWAVGVWTVQKLRSR